MTQRERFLNGDIQVAVVTSWDDGHVTDRCIGGWLGSLGLKGTFFLTTHALGEVDGTGADAVPVMSESQIQWLAALPHVEIGAHTHGHWKVECLSAGERQSVIKQCVDKLKKITGERPVSFAYPEGGPKDCPERLDKCARDIEALDLTSARIVGAGTNGCRELPIADVWGSRYCLPTSGEFGNLELCEIRQVVQNAVSTDQQVVVHFHGHSSRMWKETDHVPMSCFYESLRVLTEKAGSYDPDETWFCTQGELIKAAQERAG